MKKIIFLAISMILCYSSFGQTPIDSKGDGYSNWLFMNSDKAVQVRYKQVKQTGDVAYFTAQVRINFDDPIFCKHSTCAGYLFVFSYPTLDNQKSIEKSFKFYNSYKGTYALPDTIPIKMSFPDGSKRMLRKEGFFYTTSTSTQEQQAFVFDNCVDDILSNNPTYHRCKPYKSNFKESEAIVII